ncbi:MAG: sigma-54-dependent Fis family transcriptional regulator [Ignavibacteriaceae bacterium]|nr:sigma-54-dependent Fis family transcriptional regulator [Ignavibacteriaceae bacterium]
MQNLQPLKKTDPSLFRSIENLVKHLNNCDSKEGLVETSLDIVIQTLNAERVAFVKYESGINGFKLVAARNMNGESINNLNEFSTSVFRDVVAKKQPVLLHTTGEENLPQYESIVINKITSIIGVPVFRDNELWGAIIADSKLKRKEFTDSNLELLDFFSNLLGLALEKTERFEALEKDNFLLRNQFENYGRVKGLVGESQKFREVLRLVKKIANSNVTVLITGESGTGKDLIAKALHELSPRSNKPYLAQFCGSIPDTLLESELFGFKKGAFTGANSDKKGLLEIAEGGSFFLDEIADITPALQAKLLRVLENKEIIPLGDTKVKKIDLRIITATNKNLQELVKSGLFREDLFYRLNILNINLPPLRERTGDIPLIAKHILRKVAPHIKRISPEAIKKLEEYYWPGNIRELSNVLQRASIMNDGSILTADNIDIENLSDKSFIANLQTLEENVISILKNRLGHFKGNRSLTADSLGVSRRWVQMKLKEIGLTPDDD